MRLQHCTIFGPVMDDDRKTETFQVVHTAHMMFNMFCLGFPGQWLVITLF